jgi:arylsulfatase A-like enzyme
MTGQYGLRMGFLDVITPLTTPGHLPLDVPMLAEGIRDLGYATGMAGKWHVVRQRNCLAVQLPGGHCRHHHRWC